MPIGRRSTIACTFSLLDEKASFSNSWLQK